MSDDSDFPYLAEDRRNFRKQVGVSFVAVLLGLGIVMGEIAMHTQAFAFERGGRPFIVMIQSPTAQADLAAKLAEPVVVSVQ